MSENNNINNEANQNVELKNYNPLENNNNNQVKVNSDNIKSKECCGCSERTVFWIKIIFFPFFLIYNTFLICCDDRCQKEPYYHSSLFMENVLFCALSILELVIIIVFKGELKSSLFIIRIISDCFGIIICWLAVGLWSEEATDEDHMDPACTFFTIIQTIITVGLDITSIVLVINMISVLSTSFFILLLLLILIHLFTPLIFLFALSRYNCFNKY